ncbi:cbb3-type cytochrome c oxidase subunit I [Novacetimonas pomaceti]|uniref:Cytochrome oxidase n=1 Tax=Novacetimonas pomaceti TaxID=2021998 RepID=A0ABX5P557_9PROT|nr:cbb3-type cytochrome c oxidase subunit I [Novacetimonas pomaceti]PYD48875.1 cytochrome oxidase [Novacetimonas pomaceti]
MPTVGQDRIDGGNAGLPARLAGQRGHADGHRKVGTLYLSLSVVAGIVGGMLAVALQAGLLPHDVLARWGGGDPAGMWERIATRHGMMMVFFCVLPALSGGFGNWFVPLLTGARDMAFPRLNMACWCAVAASFVMALVGLSVATSPLVSVAALLLWCVGMLGMGINMVASVLNMRAPAMRLRDMPVFVWAQVLTAFMLVMVVPVLAAALTRIVLDGGDVLAHVDTVLHAFSGPEVALLLLPSMGIVSQVVETFCGVSLRWRMPVVMALTVMSVGGASIWTHDLFDGLLNTADAFRTTGELIVILAPVVVVMAAWGATLGAAGQVSFRLPMAWAGGCAVLLVVGGVMSLLSGGTGDVHAATVFAAVFATFAGFYYWIGKMSGHLVPRTAGNIHFALTAVGTTVSLMTHQGPLAVAGAVMMGVSILVFAGVLVATCMRGQGHVAANYWGAGARTLEWSLPSPVGTALNIDAKGNRS